jgi:hypothetical protein
MRLAVCVFAGRLKMGASLMPGILRLAWWVFFPLLTGDASLQAGWARILLSLSSGRLNPQEKGVGKRGRKAQWVVCSRPEWNLGEGGLLGWT